MAKKIEEMAAATSASEKLKALQAAMAKIEKDFGRGSIMKLGDERVEDVEVIPTGSIGLDAALGVGGYPKGRIIEIYGPESSGKTTLAIHAIAEAQKAGGIAAFIDAEHAFDRFYAEKLGVEVITSTMALEITGEGVIDGRAQEAGWWVNHRERYKTFRGSLLLLERCKNVTVQGVTFRNSPFWNIHPLFSRDLSFLNILVEAPAVSPNTDGFDPESCPGEREGHFGLKGIKERVKHLGGTFAISSEPGIGTKATIVIRIN